MPLILRIRTMRMMTASIIMTLVYPFRRPRVWSARNLVESDLSSEVDVYMKIDDLNDYEFDNWKEELEDDERMNKEKTNKLHKMMNQVA